MPKIAGHKTWLGRPTIGAEGIARAQGLRNVVIATLVDTDGNTDTAEKVALVFSNDGGQSFSRTLIANTTGDGCDSGLQDSPSLAFDYSSNPPLGYVVWRNKQHSSWGGCINSFFIDDNGVPQVNTLSHSIAGMDKSH